MVKKYVPSVVISGFGKVGNAIYNVICDQERGLDMLNVALVGKNSKPHFFAGEEGLARPEDRSIALDFIDSEGSVIIETTPAEVASKNILEYIDRGIPFLCATTGVSPLQYESMKFRSAGVFAPNLAVPILEYFHLLNQFDFSGLSLKVIESHQGWKKDWSGTGLKAANIVRANGGNFNFDEDKARAAYYPEVDGVSGDFTWIREAESQKDFGVPKEYLDGHGFHDYEFMGDSAKLTALAKHLGKWAKSGNGIDFLNTEVKSKHGKLLVRHDVLGREIYGHGVIKAVPLFPDLQPGLYNLEDILFR